MFARRRLTGALWLSLFVVGCSAAPGGPPSAAVTPATLPPAAAATPQAAGATAQPLAATAQRPATTPQATTAADPLATPALSAVQAATPQATAAQVQQTTLPVATPGQVAASVATQPLDPTAVPDPPADAAALSDGTVPGTAAGADPAADPACDGTARPDPLPAPGSARSQDFFRSFRTPLAPAPLYDPPGPKRVGLQAGHWLTDQVPPELGRLQGGAVGGGKQEWEVNLDVAQRTAALLEASGVQVDVLPSTIPPRYRANAFIALHADGDPAGQAHGFKVARPGFSSLPDVDDRLVETLNQVYGSATELPRDDEHISLRMRYYYAFNSRRYCHAVAPGVPQAILEMAYLTSPTDRQLLIGNPDKLAHGLYEGIQSFLATLP